MRIDGDYLRDGVVCLRGAADLMGSQRVRFFHDHVLNPATHPGLDDELVPGAEMVDWLCDVRHIVIR
jgi:hypothetical protein